MTIRRILAGSILALLLTMCPLAAACDLSCAFASMTSDCHAQQTETQNSPSGNMKMDGMEGMGGMNMPGMSGSDSRNQPMASGPSRPMPIHAAVADIGSCERQSCDPAPVVAFKGSHAAAAKSGAIRALTGFPHIASLQTATRDARDSLDCHDRVAHRLLNVSLRV